MARNAARSLVGLLVTLTVALTPVACSGDVSKTDAAVPRDSSVGRSFTSADAHSFSRFPLYWVGSAFERLPLTATTRRDDTRIADEHVRADYVGFIYGDCVAMDETGCPPPLEIQVWPACERSLADYRLTPRGDPIPHRATVIRGVPAAWFEGGLRLELYSGEVTIVIFGDEHGQVVRAAAALRARNALASNLSALPPPLPGAMDGRLACST